MREYLKSVKVNILLFTSIALLLFTSVSSGVQVTSVTQNLSAVDQYDKFEVTFSLDNSYSNPFDLDIIDIVAVFSVPGGSQIVVPAFYYREFNVVGSSPERYRNPGPEQWKIRFAPVITGVYSYDIRVNEGGSVSSFTNIGAFTCIPSQSHGFIRRDENDNQCMQYDDGTPRINIGHNVCWVANELAGCQNYYNNMAAVGENWTRIWMCPWGADGWVMLEYSSDHWSGYHSGVGNYSMEIAQRLDSVVELAQQRGIGIQLVLQYHGLFSTTTNSNWDDNPYNAARPQDGGFLQSPEDFFSNAEAIRLTKNKYRYIIARWGYSTAILAWELWNEVQFTDGWANTPANVIAWHQEMSDYLHDIDPHNHLVTTSSHSSGFEGIWSLDSIDLIQVHHYGTPVVSPFNSTARELAGQFNKPVIIGEFGAGSINGLNSESEVVNLPEPYRSQMEEALVLHNGIWSAFFSKSSSHLWWWDNYIEPHNQYGIFDALSTFINGEDVRGMQTAERAVEGFQPFSANPQIGDFFYVHTQTEFYLEENYFPGMELLSRYLQGSWHSQYRSDPTFHLTMPEAGQLVIHVNNVSEYGSNSLRVIVNSEVAFAYSYPAGASNFDIVVPLPAGNISVQVQNTGQDWFDIAGYEFKPGTESLLESYGLQRDNRALLWVHDVNSKYGDTSNGIFSDQPLSVHDLIDGTYNVDFYATNGPGGIVQSQEVDSQEGLLTCMIPDFTGDIAVKVTKVCTVGFDALSMVAADWLQDSPALSGNLGGDTIVNMEDVQILSSHWLDDCPDTWPIP